MESTSQNVKLFSGISGASFRRTAFVKKWPPYQYGGERLWPLPDWKDADIDEALDQMLFKIGEPTALPQTQYGRRIAVATHLAYEDIRPLSAGIAPPTPFTPSQPR